MRRILIIGCSGAGKSTFSLRLHEILDLELIHLDLHFLKANWEETEKEKWEPIVQELISRENWIMDGNYGGTLDFRLSRADTIIFLNYPTLTCLKRVIARTLKYYGKVRPNMPEDCKERFELEFLMYVLNYNRSRAPKILQKLDTIRQEKNVFIFQNDQEVENFLTNLKSKKTS